MKNNNIVHPVEELRFELGPQRLEHPAAHLFVFSGPQVLNPLAADVGGHDQDGVLKIYGPPFPVREASVIQDLQQYVEDLGVGFLDLIEEDDRIGPPANGFGQIPPLFVPYITGRGSDQPGDGVFFHEFGHIDTHHGLLVIE